MDTAASAEISSGTPSYTDLPLATSWKLWAHIPRDPNWSLESYRHLATIKTVQESIGMCELVPPEVVKYCMLFLMRDGIAPMWEDPKNRKGGCFSFKIANKYVADIWKTVVYAITGESLCLSSATMAKVSGIAISPKKDFCILKIWMMDCAHQSPSIFASIPGLKPQGCLFKTHGSEL